MSGRQGGPAAAGLGLDGEIALAATAVFLVTLTGGVWAGAQLAALAVGGHRPLHLTSDETLAALPQLAAHPGRPAAAWPDRVADQLPGPVGYWACTALPLAVLTLLCGLAATLLVTGVGVARRRRLGIDPEARFARPLDLLPLWVSGPTRGRMVLGRLGPHRRDRLVATEDSTRPLDRTVHRWQARRAARRRGQRGTTIVIGPSQCGKTAALAIPAILEWDGPLIALSVKTDLLGATIERRRRVGEVAVFDPTRATGQPTTAWSPLDSARSLAGARRAARSIVNATSWTSGSSGDMSFWTSAAEDLLAGLFWGAATVGLGMDTVVRWVVGMERDPVRAILTPLASHLDPTIAADGAQVLAAFTGLWASDRKQVSSTYLVARQMIQPWQEPDVAASATASHLSLAWLLDTGDDGRQTNTLYLSADLDDAERLAPVLGGLVDDLLRQAYAQVGRTGIPLDPPLLVVLDEAGNWPMQNLPGRISTCAGIGIQLLLVYQSKAQIDAAYGTKADVVISNAITKVFFAGQSDRSTLDYASGLLGQEHIVQTSTSTDSPGLAALGSAGRRSISQAPTRLELLPAALLRQVAPGQALLIHNTLPPAHLFGRYWYLDPDLHALATGRRLSRRALTRQAAQRRITATTPTMTAAVSSSDTSLATEPISTLSTGTAASDGSESVKDELIRQLLTQRATPDRAVSLPFSPDPSVEEDLDDQPPPQTP
ncbi:type IV secretory system conjugative DNA transfer family protein [Frankia sp. Ag45/Mut15]|uniref:Type IV secretory system conjugative DNA transfer family protein n=1 Tax=Frankia umida TaxID=573489 RepID=A0ABT0K3I9_9ACTN|nr:type IV secretory system conjugative DNA transfer family protein [Frankia umida]MCK9877848.1 type IV secretory system conjugative DNA transfer family protein [Frankia umida]